MLTLSTPSVSNALDLNQALERLSASPFVDGIASFGSRAASQTDAVSDYDLLLLVTDLPARVFQMVTTIDGLIADIVLVETRIADELLAAAAPPAPRSFEGLFAQKMNTAQILYDASNRLHRVQAHVARASTVSVDSSQPSDTDLYSIWFWQSFGLLHLERMAQSSNPIHLSAIDMMLTSCLPTTWRSYFDLRGIAWQGEKAAVRYWTEHDRAYLECVNACLTAADRATRRTAYQFLVETTVQPIGNIFTKGDTAIILMDPENVVQNVTATLAFWNSLFSNVWLEFLMLSEYPTLGATAQADLVRDGEISPLELVESAIARVEALNPQLNAVITPLFKSARAQAVSPKLADGPFRGVPLLIKDFYCEIANTPYYEGMGWLRDLNWRSKADSYLGAKFRAAGFVFLGKTNLPEMALSGITDSRAFGPARNPFDLSRTAGGSSGGSAAAVASGMVAVAHGNDGTGSIRGPASACGLVGLKPSRGRISPGPARSGGLLGNISEFVLTRSVRDTAALLDVLSGPMPGDVFVAPPPEHPYRNDVGRTPGKLRIGLMRHDAVISGLKAIDPTVPGVYPECVAAVEQTGRWLESLGHSVEYSYPTELEGPTGLGPALGVLSASGLAANLNAWSERTGHVITQDDVEPATWERAQEGRAFSAVQLHAAYQRLVAGTSRIPDWWARGFDVLVTPTLAHPPLVLDSIPHLSHNALAGMLGLFTMPYNFTGQTAISLPLYWTRTSLPIGVQFVTAYGREDLLIQLASQLETAHPWAGHYFD